VTRVGVIGGGFGAIGVGPAFRSVDGCEVVALEHPREVWRSFLSNEQLDAVAIAVPPIAQHEIAAAAIERGLHVLAEKPLAATLADARELLAHAEEHRVVHGVDFIFPEIAEWRRAKQLLDDGELGACRHVSVNWTWLSNDLRLARSTWRTDVSMGGGALAQYFSHGLYYLEHILGAISDVTGSLRHDPRSANGGEVGADLRLRFESGATGAVHLACDAPGGVVHDVAFECEEGTIVLENRDSVVRFRLRLLDVDGDRLVEVEPDPPAGGDERIVAVRRIARRFAAACRGEGDAYPTFAHAVRVHELIETIRAGATPETRGEPRLESGEP
jgi:predicted dehydrogenase